jgi:quercetin dioxygenase-like cupin family protein
LTGKLPAKILFATAHFICCATETTKMASSAGGSHPDSTVMKIDKRFSPHGPNGEVYLANGKHLGLRYFSVAAGHSADPMHERDYESAGYCLAGRAYLNLGGQERLISQGDAWVIPAHARHSWRIVEGPLETVEACSPLEVRAGLNECDMEWALRARCAVETGESNHVFPDVLERVFHPSFDRSSSTTEMLPSVAAAAAPRPPARRRLECTRLARTRVLTRLRKRGWRDAALCTAASHRDEAAC